MRGPMNKARLLGPLQLIGINVEFPAAHLGQGVGLLEQRLASLQVSVKLSGIGYTVEKLCSLFHSDCGGLSQGLKGRPLGRCYSARRLA